MEIFSWVQRETEVTTLDKMKGVELDKHDRHRRMHPVNQMKNIYRITNPTCEELCLETYVEGASNYGSVRQNTIYGKWPSFCLKMALETWKGTWSRSC